MRIYTVTGNLLAEMTYTYDHWSEGATQRARAESFQVGGKGINVTRMLQRLGMDSVALSFPGGESGRRCVGWLEQKALPYRAFPVATETRTGAVIRAPGRAETTFLGTENQVDEAAIKAAAAWLDAQPDGQVLAIGGSIPGWSDGRWAPVAAACERWTARGLLVVDTYGPPLAWFARQQVALIKVNRREFAGHAGVELHDATDARMPALLEKAAHHSHVERWVITDGPNAVWSRERDGSIARHEPPRVDEISPTGSGDVFLAGLLFGLLERKDSLDDAVQFALPLAAANAASPDVAEFDLAPFLHR